MIKLLNDCAQNFGTRFRTNKKVKRTKMNVNEVVSEFIKMAGNHRRFGKMLWNCVEEPKERPPKIFMLDDLREVGKARLKDIALQTGHSTQNLCSLYNGLVKEGLVGREIDKNDRRNTYYFLTGKGEKTLDENQSKARNVISATFSKLSEKELNELKSCLENINRIIEKVL